VRQRQALRQPLVLLRPQQLLALTLLLQQRALLLALRVRARHLRAQPRQAAPGAARGCAARAQSVCVCVL